MNIHEHSLTFGVAMRQVKDTLGCIALATTDSRPGKAALIQNAE